MDKQKIDQIEEEIKNLHYNSRIAKHSFTDADSKEFYSQFWDFHVRPVIEYSKQMAIKYNADLEVVWLGAILHDLARLDDVEPHDEIGSEKGYKFLLEKGFSEEVAEKIKDVIKTHRCKKCPPETIEQKIVASADAMAHFLPPFYVWIAKYSNKKFNDLLDFNLKKIERDYNEKIFFADEKKMVEKQYNILKEWFSYTIKSNEK
jgi:predicted hydrolase (HD superfamily)